MIRKRQILILFIVNVFGKLADVEFIFVSQDS